MASSSCKVFNLDVSSSISLGARTRKGGKRGGGGGKGGGGGLGRRGGKGGGGVGS